jgi:hypothetical protein
MERDCPGRKSGISRHGENVRIRQFFHPDLPDTAGGKGLKGEKQSLLNAAGDENVIPPGGYAPGSRMPDKSLA